MYYYPGAAPHGYNNSKLEDFIPLLRKAVANIDLPVNYTALML
jgi:hypothetical protein